MDPDPWPPKQRLLFGLMREVFCTHCGASVGYELSDQMSLILVCPTCVNELMDLRPRPVR
jgi:hypothetical protein